MENEITEIITDNNAQKIKNGIEIIDNIIKTAGNNPEVKKACNNLGKTAVIITETVNNCLLPLVVINKSFEKTRQYFDEKFSKDIHEKISKIPEENIIEPKASIAGPAMQGLAYTHEEQTLKDMYLSLLAGAMNKVTSDNAHPAFVEIIRQLTSEEAIYLKSILRYGDALPICKIKGISTKESGYIFLLEHCMNIRKDNTDIIIQKLPAMIENWIRLGLIEVDYTLYLTEKTSYSWIDNRPEVISIRENNPEYKIEFQKGIVKPTSFGKQFFKAINL